MNIGPAPQRNWDWRAAANFMCGGAGSGLMIAASVTAIAAGAGERSAALAATLLIMTGLGCVWFELGRPLRFLNVFRNPRTSWMSRESWVAVALVPAGLAAAWSGNAAVLTVVAILAAMFLYCQARMLAAGRGIPAWRVAQVVPLIVTTGLAEGTGILLILGWLVAGPGPSSPEGPLAAAALVLIGLRALAWERYRRALSAGAPVAAVEVIAGWTRPFHLLGGILPVLLLLVSLNPAVPDGVLAAAGGLCLVLSGWRLKYVIVVRAAYNQGFALAHSPQRGGGLAGPGIRPGWSGQR